MIKLDTGEEKAEEILPHGDNNAKLLEALECCPVNAIKQKEILTE